MTAIDSLIAALEDAARRLLQGGDDAVEACLDQRDRDPFDSGWTQTDASLQAFKRGLAAQRVEAIEAESERVRERVFARVASLGGGELAGYLADDAGLLLEADRAGLTSAWIEALRRDYRLHLPFSADPC